MAIDRVRLLAPTGKTHLRLIQGNRGQIEPTPLANGRRSLEELLRYGAPWTKGLSREMVAWKLANFRSYYMGLKNVALARILKLPTFHGELVLQKINGRDGSVEDFGIVGFRVIMDTGVDHISDAFMNSVEAEIMNYHAIGTGTAANLSDALTTNTALYAELTTELNPNSTRATGTQSQPSNGLYRSVGTNTTDSGTPAVTEHGLFSSATGGAGVLFDRTTFAAVNLVGANADALQSTYTVTFSAGG